MRELLLTLVCYLVEQPDAVVVREEPAEGSIVFKIEVAPDDVGRVIGRQGRVIRALRAVMRAAAARAGQRIAVEIGQ
ncbi:MAG: KH domain-containing protein [Bacillota bacterium]|nr:KH domain-containing protein [Bacillota bacterium]